VFRIRPLEFNVSTDSLDGEAPMEVSTHICALPVARESGQEWPVMSLRSKEGFGGATPAREIGRFSLLQSLLPLFAKCRFCNGGPLGLPLCNL
jgi:hypothetical protein